VNVAELMGLSEGYISKIWSGVMPGNLKLNTLETIAEKFDVEPWEILYMAQNGLREMPPRVARSARS